MRRRKQDSKNNYEFSVWQIIKFIFASSETNKFLIVLYLALNAAEVILDLIIPYFTSKLILSITDGIIDQIMIAAIAVLLIDTIGGLMSYARFCAFRKIKEGITVGVQRAASNAMLTITTSEFDKLGSGVFIERISSDSVEMISYFTSGTFTFTAMLGNVGILISVFFVSIPMCIFMTLSALSCFMVSRVRIGRVAANRVNFRKHSEKRTSLIGEFVRGIRDVRILNAGEYMSNKIGAQIKGSIETESQMVISNSRFFWMENNIKNITNALFILFGCYLLSKSLLASASLVILYHYLSGVQGLFTGLANVLEDSKNFVLHGSRVLNVVKGDEFAREKFGDRKLENIRGEIRFRNIDFSYGDRKILKKFSCDIAANSKVALVGGSGAGKTTAVNLLARLYDYGSGEITIDGVNITELDRDSLRNSISFVNQNPYIFNSTIMDNLLLAKPSAKKSEVRQVCKMAQLDDYIMSLPQKYETVLGEGGVNLSGGQRQRLAIARALLMKTKIIVFDEATSALDNKTQSEIQKSIDSLKGEYTLIIIAHRLSTIIDSDKIFMLEKGKVIASGTHAELLEKCDEYKTLYAQEQ